MAYDTTQRRDFERGETREENEKRASANTAVGYVLLPANYNRGHSGGRGLTVRK